MSLMERVNYIPDNLIAVSFDNKTVDRSTKATVSRVNKVFFLKEYVANKTYRYELIGTELTSQVDVIIHMVLNGSIGESLLNYKQDSNNVSSYTIKRNKIPTITSFHTTLGYSYTATRLLEDFTLSINDKGELYLDSNTILPTKLTNLLIVHSTSVTFRSLINTFNARYKLNDNNEPYSFKNRNITKTFIDTVFKHIMSIFEFNSNKVFTDFVNKNITDNVYDVTSFIKLENKCFKNKVDFDLQQEHKILNTLLHSNKWNRIASNTNSLYSILKNNSNYYIDVISNEGIDNVDYEVSLYLQLDSTENKKEYYGLQKELIAISKLPIVLSSKELSELRYKLPEGVRLFDSFGELERYSRDIQESIVINDTLDNEYTAYEFNESVFKVIKSIPKASNQFVQNLKMTDRYYNKSYVTAFELIIENITRNQDGSLSTFNKNFVISQLAYFVKNPTVKLTPEQRGLTIFGGCQNSGKSLFFHINKLLFDSNFINLSSNQIGLLSNSSKDINPDVFKKARFISFDEYDKFSKRGKNELKQFLLTDSLNIAVKYKLPIEVETNFTCFMAYNPTTNTEGASIFLEHNSDNRRFYYCNSSMRLVDYFESICDSIDFNFSIIENMLKEKNREVLIYSILNYLRYFNCSYSYINQGVEAERNKEILLESGIIAPENHMKELLQSLNDAPITFILYESLYSKSDKLKPRGLKYRNNKGKTILINDNNFTEETEYSELIISANNFILEYWNRRIRKYKKCDYKKVMQSVIDNNNLSNLRLINKDNRLMIIASNPLIKV